MTSSNSITVSNNSMAKVASTANTCMDASTILLRLAGKPGKKGQQQEDGKKARTPNRTRKAPSKTKKGSIVPTIAPGSPVNGSGPSKSVPQSGSISLSKTGNSKNSVTITEQKPDLENLASLDWENDEMDETTLSALRDLFNMLDQSNTGIITADNLYEELRRVDSEISYSEVEDVLKKVDKDGDGTIDFDEFLFHMTNMGGDLFGSSEDDTDEEKKKKYSRRKQLFYSAITQFSIRQTLADIEKTFRNQAPHVISHYTAGVRLIGLTTRQLERQMDKMLKSAANNDSPYAKPLQFVHMGVKKKMHKKRIQPKIDKAVSSREVPLNVPDETDPTVVDLSKEIQDTMLKIAEKKGSKGASIEDANLIMQLRQKLGSVTAKIKLEKPLLEEPTGVMLNVPGAQRPKDYLSASGDTGQGSKSGGSQCRRKNHSNSKNNTHSENSCPICYRRSRRNTKKQFLMGLGWTTPRIQYIDVPLPRIKMKLKDQPTFNDLHRIRAKALDAIDAYYHDLRQAEIRNAWDHWDRLYADVISPEKLLENFRVVYAAYSPHREEEAFVVCPWKPGPFRYIPTITKPATINLPARPNYKPGGTGRVYRRSAMTLKSASAVASRGTPKAVMPTMSHSAPLYKRDSPSPRPMSSLVE